MGITSTFPNLKSAKTAGKLQVVKSEHVKYDQVIKELKSQIATVNRKLCMYQMKYDRVIKK